MHTNTGKDNRAEELYEEKIIEVIESFKKDDGMKRHYTLRSPEV